MAEFLTLVCNQCGTSEEAPCYGWMHIGKAKKSETMTDPPANADLCSVECLVVYVGRMAQSKQGNLDDAMRNAGAKVTSLAEPGAADA